MRASRIEAGLSRRAALSEFQHWNQSSVQVSKICLSEVFFAPLRWPRLSEQFFRVDKWSLCRG